MHEDLCMHLYNGMLKTNQGLAMEIVKDVGIKEYDYTLMSGRGFPYCRITERSNREI